MHRCLQIPEILLQVVAHYQPHDKRTLAALARTCRLFEGPAADQLWREPGSATLRYILGCFTADLFETVTVSGKLTLRLLRPVLLSDWERPRRYCDRVRVYACGYNYQSTPFREDETLSLLLIWLPDGFLFPKLENLVLEFVLSGDQHLTLLLFRHLLSPRLKSIDFRTPTPLVLSVLPAITQRALTLTELRFGKMPANPYTPADHATIFSFVRSLNHIRHLTIPALDRDTFIHVARLDSLQELDVEGLSDGVDPSALLPIESFVDLKYITLSDADMVTATRLLHLLSDSPLERINVASKDFTPSASVSAFYSGIAAHIRRSSLREFHHTWADDGCEIGLEMLSSLCSFSQLTTVYIHSTGGFDLNDQSLAPLARAWPSMRSFSLQHPSSDAELTLAALLPFAQYCPELTFIEMTFDTTIIPSSTSTSSGERIKRPELGQLGVGLSRLDKAFPVARFLSAVFPNLGVVYNTWEEADEEDQEAADVMNARWQEVQELIPQLVEVRAEGRLEQGA
ncbi:hypothetical protein C8F01DRAFT_1172729 [Mycena amicta]|nr:hypothetical protein C8F01DRAFT_1172729 [Mycena amicta]